MSSNISLFYFLPFLILLLSIHSFLTGAAASPSPVPETTKPKNNTASLKPNVTEDCTKGANCTNVSQNDDSFIGKLLDNKPMLMRAFYVLLAVTSIVVVYFVIRAFRLRRKRSKSRKYGLITAKGTDLEMAPLDQDDDDDEDMTVYEMNDRRK